MKRITSTLLLGLWIFSGCGGQGAKFFNGKVTQSPLKGSWITDCVDLGGGQVNRIFASVNAVGHTFQAVLSYAGVGCTGAYTLSDTQGNPIAEPQHEFDAELQNVSGTPDGIYVYKITSVANSSFQYIVISVDDTHFHELVGFSSPHSTWADWLTEPNVSGFAADPANYSGGGTVIHFLAGSLP